MNHCGQNLIPERCDWEAVDMSMKPGADTATRLDEHTDTRNKV